MSPGTWTRTTAIPTPPDNGPEPAEVPAWELEVKPDVDGPMRGFLCPVDDEDDLPPDIAVPANV